MPGLLSRGIALCVHHLLFQHLKQTIRDSIVAAFALAPHTEIFGVGVKNWPPSLLGFHSDPKYSQPACPSGDFGDFDVDIGVVTNIELPVAGACLYGRNKSEQEQCAEQGPVHWVHPPRNVAARASYTRDPQRFLNGKICHVNLIRLYINKMNNLIKRNVRSHPTRYYSAPLLFRLQN